MVMVFGGNAFAETEFFKHFKQSYSQIDTDLLSNVCEIGDISDFTFSKDVATFTFKQGKVILCRYVDDRPTTAVFLGEGSASIDLPSTLERCNMEWCSGDSVVNTKFEACFIRMADNLDLKIREVVEFETITMNYRWYTTIKKSQGEFFFLPRIYHRYDNYFQLLRSHQERGEDGYFWADFGRYNFVYDPNCPEEVTVGYEKEGGDQAFTPAAVMQKQVNGVYEARDMSQIPYRTTILGHDAELVMGGIDGRKIDAGRDEFRLRINTDSTRFITLFLNYNLKEDSIYLDGRPVDYIRRKDFNFIGVVLPEYAYRSDTLTFTVWYDGKHYFPSVVFVDDPAPVDHTIHFQVPTGFNYVMPDRGPSARLNGMDTFTVESSRPYRHFAFQGYAAGFDTVTTVSQVGIPITVLRSGEFRKTDECLIPFHKYHAAITAAFDRVSGTIGGPPGIFEIFVYPDSSLSMPGLAEIPQIYCYTQGLGGIDMEAAAQMARQWFGAAMQFRSDREFWVSDAVPDYIGLMHAQQAVGASAFFSELEDRRQRIQLFRERYGDMPLAVGDRADAMLRTYKGSWVVHMLRALMIDLETQSDKSFQRFLFELAMLTGNKTFTNVDIQQVAEKYYGQPLDWFFDHWLYGRELPDYKIEYSISERDGAWFIVGEAEVKRVRPSFTMPVMVRVEYPDGTSELHRPTIAAPSDHFELGPFSSRPEKLYFNEFASVLCDADVSLR
jgi:hypothetical protein